MPRPWRDGRLDVADGKNRKLFIEGSNINACPKKCLQFAKKRVIISFGIQGQFMRKEVNKSNEGRYPSQLSADYDQMRLR